MHRLAPLALATALAAALPAVAQTDPAAPADTLDLGEIEVVSATPLPGTTVSASRIAANVQALDARALRGLRPLSVADALDRGIGGVHRTNLNGNERQPDVVLRGFRASPLLGLPQGLAVSLDGARINETFGDVVNWDLIPDHAISRLTALPGSNPVFGLNALGGAIVVETKSGFVAREASAQASGGSFERYEFAGEAGGRIGRIGGAEAALYGAADVDGEDGWRDFSRSDRGSAFVKGSLLGTRTRLDVSVLGALSDLRGNGAVPVGLMEARRQAVFTHPDQTSNGLLHGAARLELVVSPRLSLTAMAYGRFVDAETFNGDDSDYGECEDEPDRLCFGVDDDDDGDGDDFDDDDGDDDEVVDVSGAAVPFSDAVSSATINRTATRQTSGGVTLQADHRTDVEALENRLVLGLSADGGLVGFDSSTELGALTATRGVDGSGIVDLESLVDVDSRSGSLSAYALDQFTPGAWDGRATLTVGARATYTRVVLDDQIGTALDGDHTYFRVNPSVGVTVAAGPARRPEAAVVFGGLGVSHRAPSPVELTCADPDDPCRLPNGFQADPPLDAPVATTGSLGVRTDLRRGTGRLQVSVAGFITDVGRDILFVSAGAGRNSGYFRNVGTTRRVGVEAQARGGVSLGGSSRLDAFAAVSALRATFRDPFVVNSPEHPLADGGEVEVQAGDRLPLVAPYTATVGADLSLGPVGLSADVQAVGTRHIRGDETNALDPLAALAVVNARVRWAPGARVAPGLSLFASARNLLGSEYETGGLLGEADEVEIAEIDGDGDEPLFLTPGAPRALRVGLTYSF